MIRHFHLLAAVSCAGLCAPLVWAQPVPPPPPAAPPPMNVFILTDEDAPPVPPPAPPPGALVITEDESAPVAPPARDATRVEERHVIVQPRDGNNVTQRRRTMVFTDRAAPAIPPNSAWLGVQLSPVPAALAYHLNLKDTGAMVANIFEGSPAEKAGLDRYDVIIKADGKPVAGGMDAVRTFSESVRDKKPGDDFELTVISHGQEKTLRMELGQAPTDWSRTRPKYEEDPDVALHSEYGLRGRIMRPGPGGQWVIEDLDQFPDFRQRLERELRQELENVPDHGPGPNVLFRGHNTEEVAVRVDKDGLTLQVRREPDGRVTVRRYKAGEDADQRAKTYDNMEQLRDADREAFDLLASATDRKGPAAGPSGAPMIMPLPPQALPPGAPRVKPLPALPLAKPGERPRDEARREWEQGFFQGPLKDAWVQAAKPPAAAAPRTRFEVATDGKITVHFRDDEIELSRTYNSAEELHDQAPKLYKQYERIQDKMNAE